MFASPTVRCYRVQSQACGSGTVLNQTVSGNANTGSIDRHRRVVATPVILGLRRQEARRPRVQLCGESEASPGSLRLCLKTKQKTSQPTKRFMSKLLRIFRVVFVCTLVYASKTIQNGPKRLFDEFTTQYKTAHEKK